MKRAFTLTSRYDKNSLIESKVYSKSKLPKNVPKHDIIRITCVNSKGDKFIDCFIYPEEALLISSALMRAWTMAYHLNKHNLKPK